MIKKSFTLLAALLFVQLSAAAQGNSRISFLAGDECGKFLNVRVNHNQKYRIIKRKHRKKGGARLPLQYVLQLFPAQHPYLPPGQIAQCQAALFPAFQI